MTILEAKDLWKTYGSAETRVDALKDGNLSIEEGEFLAVVGPSGSGKSTLLHLLGGLDSPTSGTVLVDGNDLYAMSDTKRAVFRRRQIGFVFQFYNLIPVLSARENITLPLMLDNRPIEDDRIEELLELLGLTDRARHMPNELSGGQQQRVSIGRALVARPSIILADEPTGNLDRTTGTEILELLRLSVRTYKQTVVMITHDMDAASEADRIVSIEDGVLNAHEGALA
ncbi:MAG: ABC transporter ATP-binding protein [Spirochaetota bacterium]